MNNLNEPNPLNEALKALNELFVKHIQEITDMHLKNTEDIIHAYGRKGVNIDD